MSAKIFDSLDSVSLSEPVTIATTPPLSLLIMAAVSALLNWAILYTTCIVRFYVARSVDFFSNPNAPTNISSKYQLLNTYSYIHVHVHVCTYIAALVRDQVHLTLHNQVPTPTTPAGSAIVH